MFKSKKKPPNFANLSKVYMSDQVAAYDESTISVQNARKWYRKFKMVIRIWYLKVIQEDPISVADKTLENKVDAIKKRDYPILYIKWMWHMILFKISLQKTEISKNMSLLDTVYSDCQTTFCMCHHMQKEFSSLSKRGKYVSQSHSYEWWIVVPLSYISKKFSLTWKPKNLPRGTKTRLKTWTRKSMLSSFLTFLGLYWSNGCPKA